MATEKQDVSPTLTRLLKTISKNFANDSLAAILIGNIITSRVANRTTNLLVALGLMVREKKVIKHLYDYGVVCSYDEVKRFQTSAAVAANERSKGNMLRPRVNTV